MAEVSTTELARRLAVMRTLGHDPQARLDGAVQAGGMTRATADAVHDEYHATYGTRGE